MSAWYLLWMFFDALGIIALALSVPFLWVWASEGSERAERRQYDWRIERRRRREIELYGQPLRGCLYCGSECEFGPSCANRDLSPHRCKFCERQVSAIDAFCVAPGDPCWKAWCKT